MTKDAYYLGPMGDPDPAEIITREAKRIPFQVTDLSPLRWQKTFFKNWPTPLEGWRNWYRRMSDKEGSIWNDHDLRYCLLLSLSNMKRNESMLIASSYFWSNALNCFVFGHGPMSITLGDIFMLTGLKITGDVSPFKYKELGQKKQSIKTNGGWKNYIAQHAKSFGSVYETERVAFMNMWLDRFLFCSQACEPTQNYLHLAEDLAAGHDIPLGKYLLGAIYSMMNQVTAQMLKHEPISCVTGPWWLVQLWLNLYLHKLISLELHNLSFPSPNYAKNAKKETMACQTYGEAASAIIIDKGKGQFFKLFYRGFDVEILDWLPYRTNSNLTLPEKSALKTALPTQLLKISSMPSSGHVLYQ